MCSKYVPRTKNTFIPLLMLVDLPTSEKVEPQPIKICKSVKNDVTKCDQSCLVTLDDNDNVNSSSIEEKKEEKLEESIIMLHYTSILQL